jgi:hypothetical protein
VVRSVDESKIGPSPRLCASVALAKDIIPSHF